MTKIKTDDNRIDATLDSKFHAFWHGQMVSENSRVKRVEAKARLGNFSPAAIWQAKYYIESLMTILRVYDLVFRSKQRPN
jgi:hypothetical protein